MEGRDWVGVRGGLSLRFVDESIVLSVALGWRTGL